MNTEQEIKAIKEQMTKLGTELGTLSGAFYKNNFTSTQIFNKDAVFSTSLRVPVYASAPTVAEIGQLFASSAGVLYVCTDNSPVTWTIVGTQV